MNSTNPLNNRHSSRDQIADVQGRSDSRAVAINRVGIRDIRHPVRLHNRDGRTSHSIGDFTMTVALPADRRGTHMSRFVQLLNEDDDGFDLNQFQQQVASMTRLLDATSGHLSVDFPLFVNKSAPVSGAEGLCDYAATLSGSHIDTVTRIKLQVVVPATSLCPCSKEVSDYGAHNQRSLITVAAVPVGVPAPEDSADQLWLEDLIDVVETEASAAVYPVLKRADEKLVTEAAYDNPKFVEDIVRDVAISLGKDERIAEYRVECENLESIHNHSAYAMIESSNTLGC